MKCYFCKSEVPIKEKFESSSFNIESISVIECEDCKTKYKAYHVFTVFNKDEAEVAHIYYDKIHIRMWIVENKTDISITNILKTTIEGCPFTMDNFKDKIKLYLTFM